MKLIDWLHSHPLWRLQRRVSLWRAGSLTKPFHKSIKGLPLTNQEIGNLGEVLAAQWLRKHGRRVFARNFAPPEGGEVDIVCRHRDTLAFVEVKTRTKVGIHRPADAVTRDKQHLIIRGAKAWLRLLSDPTVPYRFDIAEVLLIEGEPPQINVVENAFQLK